ncbi:MAG: serine/threonine protein kinase [Myxococcaceae bacterium]|nr:serine/threonine protein kinase [Myxococcaceae bacterium]
MPWLIGLLALVVLLVGCGARAPSLALTEWTFVAPNGKPARQVKLPEMFDDELPRQVVDYKLVRDVVVPPQLQGAPLTFSIESLPAMATLHADGIEATALGVRPFDRYHATGPLRWRVPAAASDDGVIHFELTVHHRWRQSAWVESVPTLDTEEQGSSRLVLVETFNRGVAAAALATASLVVLLYGFLFLSMQGPKRNVYKLFALGGLATMFYPAFQLGLTQPLFGIFEAEIVGSMLIVAAVTAVYFSHAYFDLPPPHIAWKGWVSFAAVAAALASTPFRAIELLAPLILATVVANMVMQTLLLVRLRRLDPKPQNLYLIVLAWPATAVFGLPDMLAWLGHGDILGPWRPAALGMTLISLAQAMSLLREHLLSLSRADVLNAELASRVNLLESKQREVELLNDELRRQIGARTRQLAVSLAHGETPFFPGVELGPGAVIEDRYRVLRRIGEGGMGAVYEVERVSDKSHFALKTLTGMNDPFARARFAREAQIAANVKHPNVVALVDFDVAKEGYLFLVMEFVAGNTLHEVRRRTRDVPWTLYVLAQVAEGLDAIHAQGIVHRDLKPTNVLLSRGTDGRRPLVKITDFGVSSLLDDDNHQSSMRMLAAASATETDDLPPMSMPPGVPVPPESDGMDLTTRRAPMLSGAYGQAVPEAKDDLTKTGAVFGTPNYMAAELTAGAKSATRAADVFSLAVIAWELFTFRRPFEECPVRAQLNGRPLPPVPRFEIACPTLPRRLLDLLNRGLQHDPALRPGASELAAALRDAFAFTDEAMRQLDTKRP